VRDEVGCDQLVDRGLLLVDEDPVDDLAHELFVPLERGVVG
jgi:hypothetical protein